MIYDKTLVESAIDSLRHDSAPSYYADLMEGMLARIKELEGVRPVIPFQIAMPEFTTQHLLVEFLDGSQVPTTLRHKDTMNLQMAETVTLKFTRVKK